MDGAASFSPPEKAVSVMRFNSEYHVVLSYDKAISRIFLFSVNTEDTVSTEQRSRLAYGNPPLKLISLSGRGSYEKSMTNA